MALSPMMVQYKQIKSQYSDCLLLFRLGDFYELFFDDAKAASRVLGLVLTGRACGEEERAPMCGIPFHAAEGYITKLVMQGFRVAICEQMADPATTKGIVKREVIRVVSPGTITEGGFLRDGINNYLAAVTSDEDGYGLAYVDVSTGAIYATEAIGPEKENILRSEIYAINPTEAVLTADIKVPVQSIFIDRLRIPTCLTATASSLDILDFATKDVRADKSMLKTTLARKAASTLMSFVRNTQKVNLSYIRLIKYYKADSFLTLDPFTRRSLELTETMRSGEKKGSLLWVLDKTGTAMGARMLKQWLDRPLINEKHIKLRLDAVEELKSNPTDMKELMSLFKQIVDMERISTRLVYGTANARDLKSLSSAISVLEPIKRVLASFKTEAMKGLHKALDVMEDIGTRIDSTIADDPPVSLREGGIIKEGASAQVDEYRTLMNDAKSLIAKIEAEEKEKTGIRTLKVGYNRVFGYYIEVSKSFVEQVPEHYIRRQTLTTGERFVTEELKELEGKIIGARDRDYALEYEMFTELREYIIHGIERIQSSAVVVAETDAYCSLAYVALQNSFVRPEVDVSGVVDIRDGRHPVVEKFMGDAYFVPNDCLLDSGNNRVSLITGPNMAGKSTYMRQVALMCIMAQMGSFVPARSARLGIVDKVFTRVGASDDLATGNSTFMLEMTEVAHILKNATERSLIIYDEIGRGTSTYDGMSIARATLEYTAEKIKAKTLFATHYHELTALEGEIDGVVNYHVVAKKRGEDIVFLRKIVKGATDDSFGIEVAKLAGVPDEVVKNARKVLRGLESGERPTVQSSHEPDDNISFENIAEAQVAEKLRATDLNTLTPIEALGLLYELKKNL